MVRPKNGKVWIKIRIERSLLRRIRKYASYTGRTLDQIVEEALIQFLSQNRFSEELENQSQSNHVGTEIRCE